MTVFRAPPEVMEALKEIRRLGRLNSAAEAAGRAIANELFLQQQMAQGWQVMLRKGTELREVVWPNP